MDGQNSWRPSLTIAGPIVLIPQFALTPAVFPCSSLHETQGYIPTPHNVLRLLVMEPGLELSLEQAASSSFTVYIYSH